MTRPLSLHADPLAPAAATLRAEARAIDALAARLEAGPLRDAVERLVAALVATRGKVLVSGLGKSGLIGKKIAATLTSTGTPAVFLHPVEALHGDLGLVARDDVALILSRSGALDAFADLLPGLRRAGAAVWAMTASPDAPLARAADGVLDVGEWPDAGPLETVPTVSAAAMLALGDAVAVATMTARGITRDDLALVHPGGAIGRRLLLRVRDVMHTGSAVPFVPGSHSVREAIAEIAAKRLGFCLIGPSSGRVDGILTDGDLKRLLLDHGDALLGLPVEHVMTRDPRRIDAEALVAHAIARMEDNPGGPITSLVVEEAGEVAGVVHLHDCLRAGTR